LTGPNAKATGVPASIAAYDARVDLELHIQSGPEAQVAAIADDIAYNTHDIDDGLRAGLFTTEDLAEVPLVGPVFREVLDAYPGLEQSRLIYEAVRRLIDRMVNDCLAETRSRLAAARPESVEALRALPAPVVAISQEMRQNDRALKAFLFECMYRHRRVNRMTARARKVVAELFERYLVDPGLLPKEWRGQVEGTTALAKARVVADYIAGMTDRFALEAHHSLFAKRDKK
jgi:dGTPase